MPDVKCILIFRSQAGYGWTETHWWGTSSTNPDLNARLDAMESNLLPTRRNMLGEDCIIVGLRCSYTTGANIIASKSRSVYAQGIGGAFTASQNDSLAQQMYDSTNTRKKIIHFRGFWELLIVDETFVVQNPEGQSFLLYLNGYLQQLIQGGFGWHGKWGSASPWGWVTTYAIQTTGQVLFTISPQTQAILPAVGVPVSVRFSKINRGNSPLNKTISCVMTETGQLLTIYPIAAGPFQSYGKFYINQYQFISYSNSGQTSLGERRMGKVLGRYPGRARRRPVY